MSSPKHSSTWPVSKTAAQARAEEQARYNFERAQVDADKQSAAAAESRICHECGHECDPAAAAPQPAKASQICDECSRNLEDGALYEDHSPRGTVKQGRRPMFKSFKQEAEETLAELERVKQQRDEVQILSDRNYDSWARVTKEKDELLAALKALLSKYNTLLYNKRTFGDDAVVAAAQAAIARAEGRAQS